MDDKVELRDAQKNAWRMNQSGMAAVIALLVVLGLGSFLILGYLTGGNQALGRIHNRQQGERAVLNIFNRIVIRLSTKPDSSCAFSSQMTAIRDLNNPSPPSIRVDESPVGALNCLIDSADAQEVRKITIGVTPMVSSRDLVSLSRMVRIQIEAITTANQKVTQQKVIKLRAASLGRHSLVLTGSAGEAKFQINSGAVVDVYGKTYVAGASPSDRLNLGVFAAGGVPYDQRLFFHGPVLTRAKAVTVPSQGLTQNQLSSVFLQGINTGVFNSVPIPTEYAPQGTWNLKIDYKNVYFREGVPLPELPSGYLATAADGNQFDSVAASVATVPSRNMIGLGETAKTCDSIDTDLGSIWPMVVLRSNDDFTVDFTRNTNFGSSSDIFCGLVRAKRLFVRIRSGVRARLIGHFFVDSVTVTGSGSLSIIDPEQTEIVPAELAPPSGFVHIARQLKALEVFVGQPFFVPLALNPQTSLALNPAEDVPSFLPHSIADFLVRQGWTFQFDSAMGMETCVAPPGTPPGPPPVGKVCWPILMAAPSSADTNSRVRRLFENGRASSQMIYFAETML